MEGVGWLVLRYQCSYTHRTSFVYWNVINRIIGEIVAKLLTFKRLCSMEGDGWLVLRYQCSYTHRTSFVYWNVINNLQNIKNQRLPPTKSTKRKPQSAGTDLANNLRSQVTSSLPIDIILHFDWVYVEIESLDRLSMCLTAKSSTYILHFYLRQGGPIQSTVLKNEQEKTGWTSNCNFF